MVEFKYVTTGQYFVDGNNRPHLRISDSVLETNAFDLLGGVCERFYTWHLVKVVTFSEVAKTFGHVVDKNFPK